MCVGVTACVCACVCALLVTRGAAVFGNGCHRDHENMATGATPPPPHRRVFILHERGLRSGQTRLALPAALETLPDQLSMAISWPGTTHGERPPRSARYRPARLVGGCSTCAIPALWGIMRQVLVPVDGDRCFTIRQLLHRPPERIPCPQIATWRLEINGNSCVEGKSIGKECPKRLQKRRLRNSENQTTDDNNEVPEYFRKPDEQRRVWVHVRQIKRKHSAWMLVERRSTCCCR